MTPEATLPTASPRWLRGGSPHVRKPALLKRHSVLPGFGLSLGYSVLYLSLLVLIPLAGLFLKSASLSPEQLWNIVTAPRVLASYRLSFGASFVAAAVNLVFGLLVAWVLVRY